MSIQIYILSKLMEGNSYPYQLKKGLSEPVPFDKMANITESKLYYHFESLVKQGLIEVAEIIKEDNRPDKHVYAITEEGRIALENKVYDVFEKATQMAQIIVGLMFVRHVEIERVITSIKVKKSALQKKADRLELIYQQTIAPDDLRKTINLANAYFVDTLTREIEWHDRVLQLLESTQN